MFTSVVSHQAEVVPKIWTSLLMSPSARLHVTLDTEAQVELDDEWLTPEESLKREATRRQLLEQDAQLRNRPPDNRNSSPPAPSLVPEGGAPVTAVSDSTPIPVEQPDTNGQENPLERESVTDQAPEGEVTDIGEALDIPSSSPDSLDDSDTSPRRSK